MTETDNSEIIVTIFRQHGGWHMLSQNGNDFTLKGTLLKGEQPKIGALRLVHEKLGPSGILNGADAFASNRVPHSENAFECIVSGTSLEELDAKMDGESVHFSWKSTGLPAVVRNFAKLLSA